MTEATRELTVHVCDQCTKHQDTCGVLQMLSGLAVMGDLPQMVGGILYAVLPSAGS